MTVSEKTQRLARAVLQTANRTQARGSSVRLVVPRAPEVAGELEPLLGEAEPLTAGEYLLERGYVAPANLVLTWGTYTITPTGFHWLEGGLLEEPLPTQERLRELANRPGEEAAAFESALLANPEEERRLMEEVERESSTRCARSRQEEPRRAPRRSGRGQRAAPPGTGGGAMAEGTERRR
jgi:hypothetical protein